MNVFCPDGWEILMHLQFIIQTYAAVLLMLYIYSVCCIDSLLVAAHLLFLCCC